MKRLITTICDSFITIYHRIKYRKAYREIARKNKVEKQIEEINIKNKVNIICDYIPERKTNGSAAVDLIAKLPSPNLLFRAGETHLVPTGLTIEIPQGKCGLLLIRSGLSIQSPLGLTNGIGLIDSDYRGEIKVPIRNYSASKRHTIQNGDRIAQLLIVDHFIPNLNRVKKLNETDRSSGGFGSTGVK